MLRSLSRLVGRLLVTSAALLLLPLAASATPTVGVLGFEVDQARRTVAPRFAERLLEAVQLEPTLQARAYLDLSVDESLGLLGCPAPDPPCLIEVASALEVDRLLFGTLRALPERAGASEVVLRYVDGRSGLLVFEAQFSLPEREGPAWLGRVAGALLQGQSVIDVRVSRGREEVAVWLDDVAVGSAPLLLVPVAPGAHRLRIGADGVVHRVRLGASQAMRVVEEPGGEIRLEGAFVESAAGAARGPRPPASVWVTGSFTVAATGAAIFLGLQAQDRQQRFEDTPWRAEADRLRSEGQAYARGANLAIAAALLSGGATAWLWWRSSSPAADIASEASRGSDDARHGGIGWRW